MKFMFAYKKSQLQLAFKKVLQKCSLFHYKDEETKAQRKCSFCHSVSIYCVPGISKALAWAGNIQTVNKKRHKIKKLSNITKLRVWYRAVTAELTQLWRCPSFQAWPGLLGHPWDHPLPWPTLFPFFPSWLPVSSLEFAAREVRLAAIIFKLQE